MILGGRSQKRRVNVPSYKRRRRRRRRGGGDDVRGGERRRTKRRRGGTTKKHNIYTDFAERPSQTYTNEFREDDEREKKVQK